MLGVQSDNEPALPRDLTCFRTIGRYTYLSDGIALPATQKERAERERPPCSARRCYASWRTIRNIR
jgi:hypothetical protein